MNAALAQIVETMTQNVADLEAFAEANKGRDLSAVYVLKVGSLYIRKDGPNVRACGVAQATQYSRAEAYRMAPQMRNGNNEASVPETLAEALTARLEYSRALLEDIKARAAQAGE